MAAYVARRLIQIVLMFFPISIISYLIIRTLPIGNIQPIFDVPQVADPILPKMANHVWNLTIPWPHQYILWLQQTLSGTLGPSFYIHAPAAALLNQALGPSSLLVGTAILLTLLIGIPMGVFQARHPNSLSDQILTGITYIFMAAPSYIVGLGLLWVFAVVLRWVPAGGMRTVLTPFSVLDVLHHMILPASAIALGNIALYARYMRTSMLEQMSQLYIRTAHAKGLVPRRVYWHHVVPNALMPVVMNLATNFAQVLSGVFIVEVLFNWPGMGILFVEAIYTEDYNVLMAILVGAGILVMLANLAADIVYALVDHRVVYS